MNNESLSTEDAAQHELVNHNHVAEQEHKTSSPELNGLSPSWNDAILSQKISDVANGNPIDNVQQPKMEDVAEPVTPLLPPCPVVDSEANIVENSLENSPYCDETPKSEISPQSEDAFMAISDQDFPTETTPPQSTDSIVVAECVGETEVENLHVEKAWSPLTEHAVGIVDDKEILSAMLQAAQSLSVEDNSSNAPSLCDSVAENAESCLLHFIPNCVVGGMTNGALLQCGIVGEPSSDLAITHQEDLVEEKLLHKTLSSEPVAITTESSEINVAKAEESATSEVMLTEKLRPETQVGEPDFVTKSCAAVLSESNTAQDDASAEESSHREVKQLTEASVVPASVDETKAGERVDEPLSEATTAVEKECVTVEEKQKEHRTEPEPVPVTAEVVVEQSNVAVEETKKQCAETAPTLVAGGGGEYIEIASSDAEQTLAVNKPSSLQHSEVVAVAPVVEAVAQSTPEPVKPSTPAEPPPMDSPVIVPAMTADVMKKSVDASIPMIDEGEEEVREDATLKPVKECRGDQTLDQQKVSWYQRVKPKKKCSIL